MTANRFPRGWDEARVARVLAQYEEQTEDEAVAEDEAAFRSESEALVGVPRSLLPEVRRLLARHQHERQPAE
ncbi:MAG: hypothetical protein HY744_05415 [Deltaproteobacteria bacterium]|nr:hypothetical protein [Deltaproteobacteria bacterium]